MKHINPSIILVRPQLPENIGMVARVMHNFGLKDLKLTDYKVMILSSDKGTGAITRVLIESSDSTNTHWTTIGVSPNIIDASYSAIFDSITFKLLNDLKNKN